MPPKKPNDKRVPVSSLKHKDKRTNIPTRELQNFVKDEEKSPKTVSYPGLLYARDPSLDPQLVWKGKDEQDQKPLEVPAVAVSREPRQRCTNPPAPRCTSPPMQRCTNLHPLDQLDHPVMPLAQENPLPWSLCEYSTRGVVSGRPGQQSRLGLVFG